MVGGEKKLANIFVQQFDTDASVSDFLFLFLQTFSLKTAFASADRDKTIQNNWL